MDEAKNEIPSRQDEPQRLDLLRAQRVYYRRAKRLQTVFLAAALILPWISFFWGNSTQEIRPLLALVSVLLLLVELGAGVRLQREWVKTAVRIQEQFDTEVFGLPWNSFLAGAKVDPESIRAVTLQPITPAEKVKLEGWYERCVGKIPLPLARIVCQRTNITYDMRVRKRYSMGCLLLAGTMLVYFLARGIYDGLTLASLLLNIFVPFLPLGAFVLREHRKQADTIESLSTLRSETDKLWAKALKSPASPELDQDARNLQDAIYRNRTSNPLVYDWVYWLSRRLNEDLARHAAATLVAEAQRSLIPRNRGNIRRSL